MMKRFFLPPTRSFALSLLTLTLVSCSIPLNPQSTPPAKTAVLTVPPTLVPTETRSQLPSSTPAHTITPTFTPKPTLTPTIDQSFWAPIDHWPQANQVHTLLVDQSGDVWSGGPAGMVHWNLATGQSDIYAVRTNPIRSWVGALAQTPDKAVWAGTFGTAWPG